MRRCAALLLIAGTAIVTLETIVDVSGARLLASAQDGSTSAPSPTNPLTAILDAFQTRDIVTLTDPHGNVQVQGFLLSLIRDPRFPLTVNDIVIETASARYQDAIDRFVRGDEVPYDVLRKAWEDHTVANSIGMQAQEMIRAVRTINAALSDGKKLRIIAGDPPIDWDNITSPQDHGHWIELRDSYPADTIRRQVLDRGRRTCKKSRHGPCQVSRPCGARTLGPEISGRTGRGWAPDSRYATVNSFRFPAQSGRGCLSRTSSTRSSILARRRR
jgi:hypothetical protein